MPRRANAIEVPRAASSHRRAIFVSLGLVLWMAAIGGRLVQLQIHQHDDLAARARSQQLSSIDTAPTRGQVLDRQGKELARSLDTESFFADPSEIQNTETTAGEMAAITSQDRADLARKLSEAKDTNKQDPVEIPGYLFAKRAKAVLSERFAGGARARLRRHG